ncbi:SusD/RagB family nutrient-binding outer membrane lipoprotein [Dyadobacter crusticola]|uniref:SusD/RagB family nutrient-binding outer membrane lipoprotein n=1 Tax=Dyadobacter crusticola TaxID=292407 RepID=UPI0004E1EA0E|nr:SusD/RagB family nutrient-binding outer membrane lipoprotein [Dyadobacter crusticola]
MKRLFYFAITTVFVFATSCSSFVKDLNVDPNNVTDAPADMMLTGAQVASVNFNGSRIAIISNMWSGYMTGIQRQYLNYQNYQYTAVETDDAWTYIYNQTYIQLEKAIGKYREADNQRGIGIARVVQAYVMGSGAALYGDIPFSQFGNPQQYPNPVFDPQGSVYAGVQKLLDEGIVALESGKGAVTNKADIFFNGDAAKWIAVAHTLKARLYMETREYDKAYSEALKGIASPAGSLLSPHTATAGTRNRYYLHNVEERAGDVSARNAYLTTILDPAAKTYRGNVKTDETARFNFYYVNLGTKGITGEIEPNYLSVARGDSLNGVIAMNAPSPMVTYEENLLTLAEAAARKPDFALALTHLNRFREFMSLGGYMDPTYRSRYSLKYDAYTEADFAAGGMANPTNFDKTRALLEEILEERYVTFFVRLIGFNDIRRTRKDGIGIKLTPSTGNQLPERFFYGQNEINSNASTPNPLPDLFEPTAVNK